MSRNHNIMNLEAFRHNIMNLGNQNSKYSWRIRDLENRQTGTQFTNSVLMYKINRFTGLYHLFCSSHALFGVSHCLRLAKVKLIGHPQNISNFIFI